MAKRKDVLPTEPALPPKEEWQRYASAMRRGSLLMSAISISATGTLTISADLAAHLGESAFIVLAVWPAGPVEKRLLMIEPCTGEEMGALKAQISDSGSRRFTARSRAHQFGIDVSGQAQVIPARWDEKQGVIVGDLMDRTLRPAKRGSGTKAGVPPISTRVAESAKGSPRYVGRVNCPGCGKCVAYRIVDGKRQIRAHKSPDGVDCLGEDYDDVD